MIQKPLGIFLVDEGLISQEQLTFYQEEAKAKNQSFVSILQEAHALDGAVFAKALAKQAGVSYIEAISEEMADPTLLVKVPLKFLKEAVVIPLKIKGEVTLVVAYPTDFQTIDDMHIIFGEKCPVMVSTVKVIIDALNHYYPLEGTQQLVEDLEEDGDMKEVSFGDIDERDILSGANDAPIIKLVNYILYQADKMLASDIHVESEEKEVRVRFRIDGIMHFFISLPKRVQAALLSRIKIMADLNIAEKRIPQDGRIEIKVADKRVDIRVSVLPVTHGETVVMRLLDKERGFAPLDKLGLSARDFAQVQKAIEEPNGIFLVSGPTGSGKTTTLYSVLNRLNDPKVNIVTVEDPVEYQLQGISQVQVNTKIGLTFATALRSILRQDPDIIMIGETRDQETAQIAIQSALTGHLVLSTIHTNSAPATITRLIDMGIEPFLIASSIVACIAQRLVRKLCADCKEAYTPSPEVLKSLGMSPDVKVTFYKPKGCKECNNLGYKGRLPLFEVMAMTDAIARLTMDQAATLEIRKQAEKDGMVVLLKDGIAKIEAGQTTVEEVLSVATVYE